MGGDDTLSMYNINEPGAEGEENVNDSAAKYHWWELPQVSFLL